MRSENKEFLMKQWRWYYFNYQDAIKLPYRFEEREFGYRTFEGKIVRHLTFSSENEFKAFLLQKLPQSIFYSVSFYEEPSLPMEEKGWKGADLVFDIDLSDIDAKCKEEHDFWICDECGEIGRLPSPEQCPRCSGSVQKQEWICDKCLDLLKVETSKLLDILELDFGISSSNIRVFFSGNLGFHVSVEKSVLEELNHYERAEIVDYIIGRGFDKKIFRKNIIVNKGFRNVDFPKTGNIKTVKIDPAVTLDIHRIFRLPNSLHEKSGLIKGECHDVLTCDPFNEFVPFDDEEVEISVKYFPKIKVRGEEFLGCRGKCTVPKFLAVYLISKGLATIVRNV